MGRAVAPLGVWGVCPPWRLRRLPLRLDCRVALTLPMTMRIRALINRVLIMWTSLNLDVSPIFLIPAEDYYLGHADYDDIHRIKLKRHKKGSVLQQSLYGFVW